MKRAMTPAFEGPIVGFSGARCILIVSTIKGRSGWWVCHGLMELQHESQSVAIEIARDLAIGHHSSGGIAQVVLHGKDGRIRWERTYGADPPRRAKG